MSKLRQSIINKLNSYIGNPIIPTLTQEDRAIFSSIELGLNDLWNIAPIEQSHSASVSGNTTLNVSEDSVVSDDIPAEYMNNYYIVGITYIQYTARPLTSMLYNKSQIDAMVSGSYSRNTGYARSNNIVNGYNCSNATNEQYRKAITNPISSTIDTNTMNRELSKISGIGNGTVDYNYNTLHKRFEFKAPFVGGALRYNVGYGFVPNYTEGMTEDEKLSELDKVLDIVPQSYRPLLLNYISLHFLTTLINARGSASFSGATYTLDIGLLTSAKSKIESEVSKQADEYALRVIAWT